MSGLMTFYEKIKQGSQKNTKLSYSLIASKYKQPRYTFNFFNHE